MKIPYFDEVLRGDYSYYPQGYSIQRKKETDIKGDHEHEPKRTWVLRKYVQ